jgi:hypothetical protein
MKDTMLQLSPAKNIEPRLIKLVGYLVAIPISAALVIALLGMIIFLSQFLSVQAMPVALTLFGLAIVAVGLFAIRAIRKFLSARWRSVALRNLGEPIVSLSTDCVRLGGSFTVIYHQQIQQPVRITRLTVRLIQRTRTVSVRDVYGIEDVTVRQRDRVVQVAQRNGQLYRAESVFHREVGFTVPAGEKPTTEITENKQVEWLIRMYLTSSHRIPFQEEYIFRVLAACNKA